MNDVLVLVNKSTKCCQRMIEYRSQKGFGAKKIIAKFSRKTGQLLPLIACCNMVHFTTASVPLPDTVTLII